MKVWNLNEQAIKSLSELPETGMGFQIVEAICWGETRPFIIFNSELAIDISALGLIRSDDPSVFLKNGLSIIESLKGHRETLSSAPSPHSFKLLSSRISTEPSYISKGVAPLYASMPSSLVKKVILRENRIFHRFSAFNLDRRVDPLTGDFLPGTYATTESEVPFVPSGFAAVGRFALPTTLACFQSLRDRGTRRNYSRIWHSCPIFRASRWRCRSLFSKRRQKSASPSNYSISFA